VLVAETGGVNAMIVDSTALPEQAIRDILASAFQSAGQRCSALRLLCLQADIAQHFLTMLQGAMAELRPGDPWEYATDTGPVIDASAREKLLAHVEAARAEGRLLAQGITPSQGNFVPPSLIRIAKAGDLTDEVFGPVLHVTTFDTQDTGALTTALNASGYGLTFGLHTRIDGKVQHLVERIRAGNIYVNRNQIGAVVGSQPFGGEGLSGTGPKAGGPDYLSAFAAAETPAGNLAPGRQVARKEAQAAIDAVETDDRATHTQDLPGPTGETNRLSHYPRGTVLCLGPDAASARAQAREATAAGCAAVIIAPGLRGSA
jgi:RHH-type transcriptional regulator, proline utilization regulon repressor / proline dehydrogenase / delta 1-pyrroline-5-carboxylate dehydrogenase